MLSIAPRDRYATASTRTRRPAGLLAALVLAPFPPTLPRGGGDSTALAQATPPRGRPPRAPQPAPLAPAAFTPPINTPSLPMAPGSSWVYRDIEGGEVHRVVITVTKQTK